MENTLNYLTDLEPTELYLLLALTLVVLIIKGLALWEAARNGDRWWFIPLLFLNTLGILELVYLFAFSKKKK